MAGYGLLLLALSENGRRRSRELVLALVDDDEEVRRAVARLLRTCGYSVRAFESAEAFLAQDCQADCAILDVQLPGLSGLELEQRISMDGRGTPVVFITGHDDAATRAAIGKTHREMLLKPFDDDLLLATVAEAIRNRG